MLLDSQRSECAETLFQKALELNPAPPDPVQTYYYLAVAVKEQKKINEALEEFSKTEEVLGQLKPPPTCAPDGIYTWIGYIPSITWVDLDSQS